MIYYMQYVVHVNIWNNRKNIQKYYNNIIE